MPWPSPQPCFHEESLGSPFFLVSFCILVQIKGFFSSLLSYVSVITSCKGLEQLVGLLSRKNCFSTICSLGTFWFCLSPTVITCCEQTAPTNGVMVGTSFSFSNQLEFNCNDGFSLQGSSQRTCQRDGTWTGVPPSCERELLLVMCSVQKGHACFQQSWCQTQLS